MTHFLLPLAMIFLSSTALAQGPGRYQSPYQPYRNTLPAELNYFRRDTGLLPQYQSFVRPSRQLERSLRNINSSLTRQASGIRRVGNQLDEVERQGGLAGARDASMSPAQVRNMLEAFSNNVARTSAASNYLNYSQSYQFNTRR